jgi:AcrR family transcriptional regulator
MASVNNVRPGVRRRRDGARRVFGSQRGRLLEAAFTVVAEEGYRGLTVRRVAERAGMSSKTFYEQFSDCEECFLVLVAIEGSCAEGSDPSNVEVSRAAGIRDQGQISRMLRRLQAQGLLQNSGGATAGARNAWRLTLRGEALLHSSSPLGGRTP